MSNKDADLPKRFIDSGISDTTFLGCAKLIYVWQRRDEPDVRVLIVKVAKVVFDECARKSR